MSVTARELLWKERGESDLTRIALKQLVKELALIRHQSEKRASRKKREKRQRVRGGR